MPGSAYSARHEVPFPEPSTGLSLIGSKNNKIKKEERRKKQLKIFLFHELITKINPISYTSVLCPFCLMQNLVL